MVLNTEKSAALMTILAIIFVLMVLSAALLRMTASQTQLVEHDISRIKSKYASEAAMVRTYERLRRNLANETSHSVSGRFDDNATDWQVDINSSASSFDPDVAEIDFTVDYNPL